jgi:hypothetical protein
MGKLLTASCINNHHPVQRKGLYFAIPESLQRAVSIFFVRTLRVLPLGDGDVQWESWGIKSLNLLS